MEDIYIKSKYTDYLDLILKDARNFKHSPLASIAGLTGSCKTSVVQSWLEHNKLKNLYIATYNLRVFKTTIKYSLLDDSEFTSKPDVKIVSDKELKELFEEKENEVNVMFTSEQIDSMNQDTILVFDNYDVASQDVRDELYKLFKDLTVVDPRVPGKNKLRKVNPLMIVIINELSNVILNKPLSDKELEILNLSNYKNK